MRPLSGSRCPVGPTCRRQLSHPRVLPCSLCHGPTPSASMPIPKLARLSHHPRAPLASRPMSIADVTLALPVSPIFPSPQLPLARHAHTPREPAYVAPHKPPKLLLSLAHTCSLPAASYLSLAAHLAHNLCRPSSPVMNTRRAEPPGAPDTVPRLPEHRLKVRNPRSICLDSTSL